MACLWPCFFYLLWTQSARSLTRRSRRTRGTLWPRTWAGPGRSPSICEKKVDNHFFCTHTADKNIRRTLLALQWSVQKAIVCFEITKYWIAQSYRRLACKRTTKKGTVCCMGNMSVPCIAQDTNVINNTNVTNSPVCPKHIDIRIVQMLHNKRYINW